MTGKDHTASTVPALLRRAQWIWPGLYCHDLHNGYACFRRVVELDAAPRRAFAWLTADQNYRLRVNGRNVCRGPARGYHHSWPFDEVDLAPYLCKGRNLITVRAYNCGHSTFAYRSERYAGFLFAARFGRKTLLSDGTWRCRRQPGLRRDTPPYSLQLGAHQEWIDLSADPDDWERLGYDDSKWLASEQLRPWNTPPMVDLEPRGIPLMREVRLRPKCIGSLSAKSAADWAQARDLVSLRLSEPIDHEPTPSSTSSLSVPATGAGGLRSYLFDFGRVVVGSPEIKVRGARGGETIDLLHTEVLHGDRLAPKVVANDHSRTHLGNRMICRRGDLRHCFFHHLGFRYLTVTVRESRRPLELSVGLEACGYPMEGEGTFDCGEPELNRIWKACAHTQRICSLDAYVDTPWREQAQWWGDARIQAWNTFHLTGDLRLLRRGIRILAGQVTPDGITFGHAPTMAHNCILPDFAIIWMLTLWDDYWQSGETSMIEAHHTRVSSILDYFRRHSDPDTGLIRYDPRYWLFLDWTDLQKDGQPALLSLWLLHALDRLTTMLRQSSLPDDFEGIPDWAGRLRAAVGSRLLRADGLVCDGLNERGKPSAKTSLQAQTLAWICQLEGFDRARALERILLPWLREDRISHAPPSSYWCAYPLDLLAEVGYGREVLAYIKRRWAAMAEFGSCYENFLPHVPGQDMMSHSHAWSAHPLYLLMRILGGIRQAAPGWAKVRIDPTFEGRRAKVAVPTPRGLIRVEWDRVGDGSAKPRIEIPKSIQRLRK